MTPALAPQLRAFQGAVRLAAALSFESLRQSGWTADELVDVMDSVQDVYVSPSDEHDNATRVTVEWLEGDQVGPEAIQRLNDEGDLPLFLFMLSAQTTEPSLA